MNLLSPSMDTRIGPHCSIQAYQQDFPVKFLELGIHVFFLDLGLDLVAGLPGINLYLNRSEPLTFLFKHSILFPYSLLSANVLFLHIQYFLRMDSDEGEDFIAFCSGQCLTLWASHLGSRV